MANDPTFITLTLGDEHIDRLDVWITAHCEGFSRARIQGLLKAGNISLNGRPITRATVKTKPGDSIVIEVPPPVPANPEPENIPLDILFEDDDLLVLNKPAGLVVHPAPGHLSGTLVNALLFHCPNLSGIGGVLRPGIVHRLDQDTSGVLVVAKTQLAMDALARQFATHTDLHKTYLALVHGTPEPVFGRIENLIGRCPFDRKKMAIVERNGKTAITHYRVLQTATAEYPLTLLECNIETGRTHQIRVHTASSLGCPIAGDALYGRPGWDKRLNPIPKRQMLHAWKLTLLHPQTKQSLSFTAPIPDDFKPYLK